MTLGLRRMGRTRIARMNKTARREFRQELWGDEWETLRRVAESFGLVQIATTESCILYREQRTGCHVCCWVDAPSHKIEPGGLGFDDQVVGFEATD